VISDRAVRHVVSRVGWVDGDSVWHFDSEQHNGRVVSLSEASFLVLAGGTADLFAATHHFDDDRLMVTAQSYAEPDRTIAGVDIRGGAALTSGDMRVWDHLPRVYVGYLNPTRSAGYYLVRIGADEVALTRLDWFDSYDQVYQSVLDAVEVPRPAPCCSACNARAISAHQPDRTSSPAGSVLPATTPATRRPSSAAAHAADPAPDQYELPRRGSTASRAPPSRPSLPGREPA
jgi:hypothetical protein